MKDFKASEFDLGDVRFPYIPMMTNKVISTRDPAKKVMVDTIRKGNRLIKVTPTEYNVGTERMKWRSPMKIMDYIDIVESNRRSIDKVVNVPKRLISKRVMDKMRDIQKQLEMESDERIEEEVSSCTNIRVIQGTPKVEGECQCNVCRTCNHYLRTVDKLEDEKDKKWMHDFLEHFLELDSKIK